MNITEYLGKYQLLYAKKMYMPTSEMPLRVEFQAENNEILKLMFDYLEDGGQRSIDVETTGKNLTFHIKNVRVGDEYTSSKPDIFAEIDGKRLYLAYELRRKTEFAFIITIYVYGENNG